ncbi:MAG: hypothetical protein QOJ40_412 [Verrucomicrobiota bacterium]
MIRLVQLRHANGERRVALVQDNQLRLLRGLESIYTLAQGAINQSRTLEQTLSDHAAFDSVNYDAVHRGASDWRLLPAFDHPDEPARCLVTGTGLTHKASAENRQAMHAAEKPAIITDSLRMYQWGLEGGRPAPGAIGTPPEWFYKGCGTILRAHGEPLEVPPFALDGGEEAEVAGAYIIGPSGAPRRVGLMLANEFSDHKMEQKNYLYLAPSKLRTCAVGPELIVNGDFSDARGTARILREGKTLWSKSFATGQRNMSHTVANLEHHHFKYAAHRRPGDAHIHFFGADVFSFGDKIELADGDVMEIELPGFGRPLRNPIRMDRSPETFVEAEPI